MLGLFYILFIRKKEQKMEDKNEELFVNTIRIEDGTTKYDVNVNKHVLANLGISLMEGLNISEEQVLSVEVNDDEVFEFKFTISDGEVDFINSLKKEDWALFVYCLIYPLMNEMKEKNEEDDIKKSSRRSSCIRKI